MKSEEAGFIGSGITRQLIADRILGAGFQLTLWKLTIPERVGFTQKGVQVASSCHAVVAQPVIVNPMIADGATFEAVSLHRT